LSLDRLKCDLNGEQTKNINNIGPLCRLKELSENNKDHQQALDFHVSQMRVERHHLKSRVLKNMYFAFDIVSEYGRSISKPCSSLIISTLFFGFIYSYIAGTYYSGTAWIINIGNGFLYALSQIVPFVSSGRSAATESINKLFSSHDIPNWLYGISLIQGAISFVLLFLIGLALRNRFRL
jgi:hypothetical protein